MSVKEFMTPLQANAFDNAWHGEMKRRAPTMSIYPSGEQIGLSLNK
jgi:hypothetical protein